LINAGFGTAIAAGLTALGIEYALLWGVTAALLRFVPYVGSLIAMAMPMALAFVQYDGWAKTVETLALFLALEATTANVVEPLIIGRHTGVSALALLVTALFWTWLWGPLGLVLSTPLTVCLAVVGKHVPQLEFLAVLLGDEEPLEADVTFYQRLLARDEDEAADIVEERLGTTPPDAVFDGVVVPALALAGRDRARDEISDADHQWVLKAANEIVQQVVEAAPALPPGATAGRVLGVPVRHAGDEILLTLLCQVLDGPSCRVEQVSSATLASEVIETIERDAPDLVCLAALPPGGVNHLRYLCKRIRARTPDLKILVVRPGVRDTDPLVQRLTEVGADAVVGTLAAARDAVARLLLSAPAARAETTSRLAGETRA
ncbi:MAG TPA: AI-2E family transporter, partial [Candidatus Binatia bacterium]|nr:AI-2E family transporter [Candidatus Binatia bacterium]